MMHMMESLTASMNETFNTTTMSMNEMLHKSQASTETTLERMQRAIAAMADRVQTLETRLPIAATDPSATAADTHADGDPFAEDPGVDNDEHSELPNPPPRQRRPFNRQDMGGNHNHHNQHSCRLSALQFLLCQHSKLEQMINSIVFFIVNNILNFSSQPPIKMTNFILSLLMYPTRIIPFCNSA
jgi:hypothetical protein